MRSWPSSAATLRAHGPRRGHVGCSCRYPTGRRAGNLTLVDSLASWLAGDFAAATDGISSAAAVLRGDMIPLRYATLIVGPSGDPQLLAKVEGQLDQTDPVVRPKRWFVALSAHLAATRNAMNGHWEQARDGYLHAQRLIEELGFPVFRAVIGLEFEGYLGPDRRGCGRRGRGRGPVRRARRRRIRPPVPGPLRRDAGPRGRGAGQGRRPGHPDRFQRRGQRLNSLLAEAARRWGTPLYVTSVDAALAALATYQQAFPGALIAYAVKANADPHLLRRLVAAGAGCEVVNAVELALAVRAGCPAEGLVMNGIGKTDADHVAAIAAGALINAESLAEPGSWSPPVPRASAYG